MVFNCSIEHPEKNRFLLIFVDFQQQKNGIVMILTGVF